MFDPVGTVTGVRMVLSSLFFKSDLGPSSHFLVSVVSFLFGFYEGFPRQFLVVVEFWAFYFKRR